VAIANDSVIRRAGPSELLAARQIEVVGRAADGDELVALVD
jgi:hypothetical protein